jgi:hypothetical protein
MSLDLNKEFERALWLNEEILQRIYNVAEVEGSNLKMEVQKIINQEIVKSIIYSNMHENPITRISHTEFKYDYLNNYNETISDEQLEECIEELKDYYKQYKVEINIQNFMEHKSVECIYKCR